MKRLFAAGMACLFTGLAAVVLLRHVVAPVAATMPAQQPCRATAASYQHQADPRYTAQFIRPPHTASSASPYLLLIRSATQHNYWFRFAASNGYGGLFLVPVQAPEAGVDDITDLHPDNTADDVLAPYREQLRFYPLDEALHILDNPPLNAPDDSAPAFLLMPELGNLLWYEPGLLNGQPGTARETLPRGLFSLAGCAR